MIGSLTLIIALAPALAIVLILVARNGRAAEAINLAGSVITLVATLFLVIHLGGRKETFWGDYIIVDGLGVWAILCTAIVYFLASMYAVGYMRLIAEGERLNRFYAMFAGFALTTLVGPLMNNAGLYWIAIELTTLISTFLVAFEHEAASIEAAWKYIIVVSAGISLALLGTVLFYWSGTFVLGPTYDMTWARLQQAAPHLNPAVVSLAFLLVLIGYGTKVGLAPMHTWLPDAHSEGPAPVSALLSGALLNTAMIGIVRYLAVADASSIPALAHGTLLVLGALSLFVASLFIVRQTGLKRLMAYSSIEHMGMIALGFGFGGPLGVTGALYHMLNHSLNKSAMFFGAGSVMRAYGTKRIPGIHGISQRLPVLGALWLAGAVGITGAPPFGLFLSELTIIRAGLSREQYFVVGLVAVLLIVIFIGFLNHFRTMYFDDAQSASSEKGIVSPWCLAPVWLALLPLFLFGVWWPQAMWEHFQYIAASLSSISFVGTTP
ncbi:NADH dehydrogenase [Labrys sp. WJW]|uniref:proton-conducting transporter transmembrane domain-containing protein n=1 Tax=Labrys sp. WJW TaxID=1737983 RepID=UPI00082B5EBE|nr:proton-conducting transporter membrane subunit [Labrys sp. WJW]OCC05543.1 NADH dehydrogenase [Labrys sp. WJW]